MSRMEEDHGWVEYRRLILKELEQLNAACAKHSVILSDIDRTLVKQAGQLGEHMRRTEVAERNIKILLDDMEPIKKRSWMMGMIFKGLTGAGAAVAGIIELFKYFHK